MIWRFKLPTEHPIEVAAEALQQVLGPLRCPAHGRPAAVRVSPAAGGVAVTIETCCAQLEGLCRGSLER